MSKLKILFLIIVVIILVFSFVKFLNKNIPALEKNSIYQTTQIKISEKLITVKISDTETKRELGLSGRQSLPTDTGMLFVFDQPGIYPFWMKEMNFPIDIIWFDADKKIIDLSENLSPQSFPKSFSPKSPAQFVLEVPANFIIENQIKIGEKVFVGDS